MLRGIYYVDLGDKEFNETLQDARNMWGMHMDSALPCESRKTSENISFKAPKDPKAKPATTTGKKKILRIRSLAKKLRLRFLDMADGGTNVGTADGSTNEKVR